jgi:polar amino acid transport system permease protein
MARAPGTGKKVVEQTSTMPVATGDPQHPVMPLVHGRRRRSFWTWTGTLLVGVIAALIIDSVVTNPRFQWNVVWQYLTVRTVLAGLGVTLYLTVVAMAIGVVLGTVLAVTRLSGSPVLAVAGTTYVNFFRGSPVLIQLIFWFNLAALYPRVSLGVPFGPQLVSVSTNTLITPTVAAVLGLGLNEAAYMSEIVRAGIQSVDAGQTEAAESLGMTKLKTLRRVVLPQAMRLVIPPAGNETITMMKTTALVSVIGTSDLLYSVESIYTRTFQTIPLLIVASIWYLAATTVAYVLQRWIERRFSHGFVPVNSPGNMRPLRRMVGRARAGQPIIDARLVSRKRARSS